MTDYVAYLKIIDIQTREVVHRIGVTRAHLSERMAEKLLRGALMKTDTDRFYVDDSEIDAARARQESEADNG